MLTHCGVKSYQLVSRILSQSWWHHQMETFSALLAICAGNSPVPDDFRAQMPVTRSFDVFYDLRLNKRLSKQSWGWWFETLLHPLWRHCNDAGNRCVCLLPIHTLNQCWLAVNSYHHLSLLHDNLQYTRMKIDIIKSNIQLFVEV